MPIPVIVSLVGVVALAVAWYLIFKKDVTQKGGKGDASGRSQGRSGGKEAKRLPYRFDSGNLFVWGETVWAGWRVQGSSDGFLPGDRLEMLATSATNTINSVSKDDRAVNVQVRVTHKPFSAEDWYQQLVERAWNPSPMYKSYLRVIAGLLRYARSTTPTTYIFVELDKVSLDLASRLEEAADAALMGHSDEFIAPAEAAGWARMASAVEAKLRGFGVTRTTRDDRMWLIRKTLSGHFLPAMGDFPRAKPWGAGQFLLWLDFEADNLGSHLVIHTMNEHVAETDRVPGSASLTSYTACLAVAEWPEELVLNAGSTWLRWLAARPEEPEVAYRIEVVPPKQHRAALQKADRNLNDERNNLQKHGRRDDVLDMDAGRSADFLLSARTSPQPGLRTQVLIQVSAPSEEELDGRISSIKEAVKREVDDKIELVRPRRWQWRMVQLMLPGSMSKLPIGIPYIRTTDSAMFGVALPNGGGVVGDRPTLSHSGATLGWVGHYIGSVGEHLAFFSPMVGPAKNAGGGVAILGASGSGKSNLAMLNFFLESGAGTECTALDPKGDFAQFVYYLSFGAQVNDPNFAAEADAGILGTPQSRFEPVNKEFWDESQVINVTQSRGGVLQPWRVEKDDASAQMLAMDLLQMFLGPDWDLFRPYVQDAMASMLAEASASGVRPSMATLAKAIREEGRTVRARADDEGRSLTDSEMKRQTLGLVMEQLTQLPYASLVFGDEPDAEIETAAKRRIIYVLRGLQMPKAGTDIEKLNASGRFAAAIMFLLTKVASARMSVSMTMKPGTNEMGNAPKLLFIDEANMVVGFEAGAQMVKETFGKGRSFNFGTVLIDQQAGRIAAIEENGETDATANQLNTVFGFKVKSPAEGKRMLPLFGRDPANPTQDDLLLANQMLEYPMGLLSTGSALMRDADGNIGLLNVDLVFRELAAAMDTNPMTRTASQAEWVSPDPADWSALTSAEVEASRRAAMTITGESEEAA